jgi:Mrp family chromosome partitioning ATPase
LVVRKARTPRDTIKNAKERIPKEKFLGVIFNGHEESKKYYKQRGKGSGSGYGYGYGYGHVD